MRSQRAAPIFTSQTTGTTLLLLVVVVVVVTAARRAFVMIISTNISINMSRRLNPYPEAQITQSRRSLSSVLLIIIHVSMKLIINFSLCNRLISNVYSMVAMNQTAALPVKNLRHTINITIHVTKQTNIPKYYCK